MQKNDFSFRSSGPGESSIAPPYARRKTGVQRISSGSSARPMTSWSRQNASIRRDLRAAALEELVRLRDAPWRSRRGRPGPSRNRPPPGCRLWRRSAAGDRAASSARGRARAGSSRPARPRTRARPGRGRRPGVRSTRRVWRSLAAKSSGAEPALTFRRRQDDVPEVRLERAQGSRGRVAAAARRRGTSACDRGVVGAASAAASASSTSSPMPASCRMAISVWNRETGRPPVPTSSSPAASTIAGSPSSRPATEARRVGQRRELARQEREDAGAQEVDPGQRVPALVEELRVARSGSPRASAGGPRDRPRSSALQRAAASAPLEAGDPALGEGEPGGPAGAR